MKNIQLPLVIVISLLVAVSFAFTNNRKSTHDFSYRTCEYSFYLKCKGSNQFVETVRAKNAAEAKTMVKNRYNECTIQTKDSNGKNCE